MAKDAKLQALRTTCEIEEQQAVEQKKKIDVVVEERRKVFEAVNARCERLTRKLKELKTTDRGNALCRGDAGRLSAIIRYERRLNADLVAISAELEEKKKELQRAADRARLAEQALIEARIAKRKIEKFLENQQQSARILSAAVEEITTDEMSLYKRK